MHVCRQVAVKAYYTSVRGQLYRTGRNPRGAKEDFENSVNLKIRKGTKTLSSLKEVPPVRYSVTVDST